MMAVYGLLLRIAFFNAHFVQKNVICWDPLPDSAPCAYQHAKKEGPHKKASLKKDIAAFCQIWISIFSPQLNWRTVTPALLNIQAAAMPDWL